MSEPCQHEKCGQVVTIGRYPNGWVRLDVAGSGEPHRRFCSLGCLARSMGKTGAVLVDLPSPFREPTLPDVAVALALLADASGRYVNLMSATPTRVRAMWATARAKASGPDFPLLEYAYELALDWAERPYRRVDAPAVEAVEQDAEEGPPLEALEAV